MTKAEQTLAAIRHQHLHNQLFKTAFNLVGQRVEDPKKFTPRPAWKQEPLFDTKKGER